MAEIFGLLDLIFHGLLFSARYNVYTYCLTSTFFLPISDPFYIASK